MNSAATRGEFITLEEARYLTLVAQGIETGAKRSTRRPRKSEVLDLINQISVVQIDSISVVSRAHETTIWTRKGTFETAHLSELHHPDAALFEYWMHAASLIPIDFFPFVRRQMESYASNTVSRSGTWALENQDLLKSVLKTIEIQGPLSTRAFNRPEGVDRSPWDWWGGKPAKQALDWLWTCGELVILQRSGFERVYDLTDRALPAVRSSPIPTQEEQDRFFTARALQSVGIGTAAWFSDFFRPGSSRYVNIADTALQLAALEREGTAVAVTIEGIAAPAWFHVSLLEHLAAFRTGERRPKTRTLMSPFDNVLWRRERALALFGFDYRIESYTPEPLRQYGYYSLPVLIDGRFVGRLDPRYRRKEGLLSIQSIHLEPGIRVTMTLVRALAGILRDFTAFLGGDKIEVVAANPETLGAMLRNELP